MNNGGSAFPVFNSYGHGQEPDYGCASSGMSLRDWFAGQALNAILPPASDPESLENLSDAASIVANMAYIIADAMIFQREKETKYELCKI
jgi:hypothetical protein